MFTISSILADIDRGCAVNNMVEDCFSYRLVYFVNQNGKGIKFYVDTSYTGLREELENIIRENLTTTNTVVLAAVTVLKNGKAISLLSRAYSFSLSGYFEEIFGEKEKKFMNKNYGRKKIQWG